MALTTIAAGRANNTATATTTAVVTVPRRVDDTAQQRHRAGGGELHRVAQQVHQRLRQARGVAAQLARQAVGVDDQLQPLGARGARHQRAAARQQGIDGEGIVTYQSPSIERLLDTMEDGAA